MVDQIKAAWAGVGTVTASSVAKITGSNPPPTTTSSSSGGGDPNPKPTYAPVGRPGNYPGEIKKIKGVAFAWDIASQTWNVVPKSAGGGGGGGNLVMRAGGGMIPKYFRSGGFARGTDTVPAMLTPGEFVVSRSAVKSFGIDGLKAINSGTYSSDSVYNYSVNVSVKSDANPDEIARAVMTQIKQVDAQRIRGNRF